MKLFSGKVQISSFQLIILGFLGVILLGSLFLMLPIANVHGIWTPFLDSTFTATSAVCVTGLVVRDTATYWSMFGQFIILLLIQIGGMGVVTVAVSIAMISGKKIGLMQRSTMQESISAPQVGGILKLMVFILKTTFCVELLGALCLFPVFAKDFGVLKGIWYAVFHSISAFCNAGFDLMGVQSPFSSLTSYVGHPVVNSVIMFLIVFGGIGFITWNDIYLHKHHFQKYRMQSKVILTGTLILIVVPAIYFYVCEFRNGNWEMLSAGEKIWASLFQSVTPRTAGFNTIDYASLTESSQFLTIILMLIGGSPGSTAGGMKTTTVMVLLFTTLAVFRRREDAQCFGRRIPIEIVRNASAILMLYLVLFLFGGIIISTVETLPLLSCLFECASALGTVGLTTGITTELGVLSKWILIGMMYMGRVGGITLVYAAMPGEKHKNAKFPQERINVG